MNIRAVKGDATQIQADAIIVNLFEGVEKPGGATGAVDKALGGIISELIARGDMKGKLGETVIIPTFGKIPSFSKNALWRKTNCIKRQMAFFVHNITEKSPCIFCYCH